MLTIFVGCAWLRSRLRALDDRTMDDPLRAQARDGSESRSAPSAEVPGRAGDLTPVLPGRRFVPLGE